MPLDFIQPATPDQYTLNTSAPSSAYPIAPTLTSAQAEANPLSSGVTQNSSGILDSFNNWLGKSMGMNGPAVTGTGLPSLGSSSTSGGLSGFFSLFSPANLTRGLVIVIGIIFLIIGLAMLGKQPIIVQQAVKAVT